MLKVKFNPLLHRNFEEIRDDDHNRIKESGTIPRTLLRMPNLCWFVEKDERLLRMKFKVERQTISIEPEISDNEKNLKRLLRYRKIHHWKIGRKISLKSEHSSITDRGSHIIGAEALGEVQQFLLYLRACKKLTNDGGAILAAEITRNNPYLRHLMLGLAQSEKLTDECVKKIAKEISMHLLHLRKLNLQFSGCENLSDKGFVPLGFSIATLPKLEQLMLYFDSIDNITSKGLATFGHTIALHLRELKQLRLSFGWCDGIDGDGIEQFHAHLAEYQTQLQLLTLNYCYLNLTDRTLEVIAELFAGNLSSLRQLIICFDNCRSLTDKGIEALGLGISKNLPKLTTLTLSLFGCDITQACPGKLYSMLNYIPNVKIISKYML